MDLTGLPLRELRTRLASLPPRSIIIYSAVYSDGEGAYLAPIEALARFAGAANAPIITTIENQVGAGASGGMVLVPSAIGAAAGALVLRLFDGETPESLRVPQGTLVKPVFDWRQLQKWGIDESRLPAGSEIRFRDPNLWNEYRPYILGTIAAVVLQAVLIGWLLYEHGRRSRAELSARNSLEQLGRMDRIATAGELLASLAHEINQPLAGMVLKASAALRWLAREKPEVEKAREAIRDVVSAGHRAGDIVNNIRGMFSKDTNNKGAVDINNLIRSVLGFLTINLRKQAVETRSELRSDLPSVLGNEVQLQQVFLNLMMNAIEAMSAAPKRLLSVTSELSENGQVVIAIEDTGSGIDPANLDRIFKPLFTTKTRGMGMGLSICRSIVENHDGKISLSSSGPGTGTAFRIELPGLLRTTGRSIAAAWPKSEVNLTGAA
jgi:signal transduction histidine kinase